MTDDVANVPSLWLVSGKPTKMVGPMAIVSVPTTVQVDPSVDRDAVNRSPVRSSFTQLGAVPAPPAVFVDTPPAATRRWNARPLAP